jgi:hypothetical protein
MSQPLRSEASVATPRIIEHSHSTARDASAQESVADRPWYREERWLAVALSSLVVGVIAFAVPTALRYPILAASGVLASVSLVMMFRREILLSRESASAARPAPRCIEAHVSSRATWQPLAAPFDENDNGKLDPRERRSLPDTAFAFPVRRELPLVDVDHVRAAIGKVASVKLVSDEDRRLATTNIEAAAAHFGIEIPA